jgi:hypothetical protein
VAKKTRKEEKDQDELGSVEGTCDYHICGRKGRVFRCKYCGGNYCSEHKAPKPPKVRSSGKKTQEEKWFEEEWKKGSGHPCLPYVPYFLKSKEKNLHEYYRKMDRLVGEKPKEKLPEEEPKSKAKKRKEEPEEASYKKPALVGVFIVIAVIIAYFAYNFFSQNIPVWEEYLVDCTDGTHHGTCSGNVSYYCNNGTLIQKASVCGCPEDFVASGDACIGVKLCLEGTKSGHCSNARPLYCLNGTLVNKATVCGCPDFYVPSGDDCISTFRDVSTNKTYDYILNKSREEINITVYPILYDYLTQLRRYENGMYYINQTDQAAFVQEVANRIKQEANGDDRVRLAVSMVQKMSTSQQDSSKYPYEVLYTKNGTAREKSRLLALMLKDLGYGVALLEFGPENHTAVGVKCPEAYDYMDTGYCFVETTVSLIITDGQEEYAGVGKLVSSPEIIPVADGSSFAGVFREYNDTQRWITLNQIAEAAGWVLSQSNFQEWWNIVNWYGIPAIGSCSTGQCRVQKLEI